MTKYAKLVELVKDKGWKNISRFTRDIRLNGTQSQAIRRDEFSDKVIEKICEALDYTAEELADALGEDVAKTSQEVAKPLTFEAVLEAVAEATEPVPELKKTEPVVTDEQIKADIQEAVKAVEDDAPDDAELEASIIKAIDEAIEDNSNEVVEINPDNHVAQYLADIGNLADEELEKEFERWKAAQKANMILAKVENDLQELWKKYNSDAPDKDRFGALAQLIIVGCARLNIETEEAFK